MQSVSNKCILYTFFIFYTKYCKQRRKSKCNKHRKEFREWC